MLKNADFDQIREFTVLAHLHHKNAPTGRLSDNIDHGPHDASQWVESDAKQGSFQRRLGAGGEVGVSEALRVECSNRSVSNFGVPNESGPTM